MAISKELARQAAESISEIEGLTMGPASLIEDVVMLAHAFPDEADFVAACASTCRAISNLISGRVTPDNLKYDFEGWKLYHYQHRVGQGMKANCRIVYRETDNGIEVMGFGNRHIPFDFYARMDAARNDRGF